MFAAYLSPDCIEGVQPMKTLKLCLIAGVALGLPLSGTMAQPRLSSVKYCDALIGRYNAYASNLDDWKRSGQSGAGEINAAIASCEAGDTDSGIPALEKALRDRGVGLPSRS
jgi:hypothetical protein